MTNKINYHHIFLTASLILFYSVLTFSMSFTKEAEEKSNLKILEIEFEPIHQGKNVTRIQVQNVSSEEQVLGVHIFTRSPEYGRGMGWGRQFFRPLRPGDKKWLNFGFKIPGPVTDNTLIQLSFYNPESSEIKDYKKYFHRTRYIGSELDRLEKTQESLKPASKARADEIIQMFRGVQKYINEKKYEEAWKFFTEDYKELEFMGQGVEYFRDVMEESSRPNAFHWKKDQFLGLKPKSVSEKNGKLVMEAEYGDQIWNLDVVQEEEKWKFDWVGGFTPAVVLWANWKERLLPTLQKLSTDHFEIHYFKNSTAEKEINQIAEQREMGFQKICEFLREDSDLRIQMVLFEDGRTKQEETGHRGMGWAVGNTIVEIYNEREKLNPFHEMAHILMDHHGNPPALFNEGFAVYISEKLGSPALKSLGGGLSSINERVRKLKDEGDWVDLEELFAYTEIGSEETRPKVSYAEAAAFVKFLIEEYGKTKFLHAYKTLKNYDEKNIHQENLKILTEIYGKSLKELEKEWEEAFRSR